MKKKDVAKLREILGRYQELKAVMEADLAVLEGLKDEAVDAYDKLGDRAREGERGQKMETVQDRLNDAYNELNDADTDVDNLINALVDVTDNA